VAGDLTDADAVAIARAYLAADPRIVGAFPGTPTDRQEAPYPCLRLVPGAASVDGLAWLSTQDVAVEVYDWVDNRTGDAELRRLTTLACVALRDLPELPYTATDPVVSQVDIASMPTRLPVTGGHNRWVATVRVYVHPPAA
jgi:hypothetical protein